MSAGADQAGAPSLADAAMSAIRGGRDAQHLVHSLRAGFAPADTLLNAMQQVRATGDAERMRGFCRELQKRLEQEGGRA